VVRPKFGFLLSSLMFLMIICIMAGCTSPFTSVPEDAFIAAEGIESSRGESLQVAAGGQLQLRLGRIECCVFTEPIEANLRWSADEITGVDLETGSGLLTVAATVADGTRINVEASTLLGTQTFEEEVVVYQPEQDLLVGTWREVGQLSCQDGGELPVQYPIREFVLQADGSFQVTWFPFEAYVDYVGDYTAGEDGSIEFGPRERNYLPDSIDGAGQYQVDDGGRLTLTDIWLGGPPNESVEVRCGHIFERE